MTAQDLIGISQRVNLYRSSMDFKSADHKGHLLHACEIIKELQAEVTRLLSTRKAMNGHASRWEKLYNYQRRHRKWALKQALTHHRTASQLCIGIDRAIKRAEKAEAEVEQVNSHSLDMQAGWVTKYQKDEADKAKLTDFINEVKNSADRGWLRKKAEKLIMELGEK